MLRNRAANEDLDAEGRANVELRLKLVMDGELEAAIRGDVERLAPGALRHIDAGGDIDLKAIAAGEAPQPVVVSPSSSRQTDSKSR